MAEKINKGRILIWIVFVVVVVGLIFGAWSEFRWVFIGRTPSQPVSGYAGDWKIRSVHGEEERPLPPAAEIWRDYESWTPTNGYVFKYYLARLGHAERQIEFRCSTNAGMTLGDRVTTRVKFLYRDPTHGDYALIWDLVGKHDVNFLKFDDHERWYQLQPLGPPGQPPVLQILGIEGFAPFYN
ncbi:MAG: hypothetical protein AAB370_06260 [Verrucomicrobiota bacterium]